MATYSLLGGPFAVLRPIVAFVTAMLGGVFTNLVTKNEPETGVAVVGESHEHEYHGHGHSDCEEGRCSCGHDVDESALKKAIEDAGFEFGGRV